MKTHISLSIDTDLKKIAENFSNPDGSRMNLSDEFEQWIRIRMNKNVESQKIENPDFEIAKLQSEIQRLQTQKELQLQEDEKKKEELMIVDSAIDNELKFSKAEEIPLKRSQGLQFLFRKKFGKNITQIDAENILKERMKERGLNG